MADLKVSDGAIRFDNVAFQYANRDTAALKNVSLEVKPEQTVALVGASGSGSFNLAQSDLALF